MLDQAFWLLQELRTEGLQGLQELQMLQGLQMLQMLQELNCLTWHLLWQVFLTEVELHAFAYQTEMPVQKFLLDAYLWKTEPFLC